MGDTNMKDNPFFKGNSILVVIFLSVLALGYIDYVTGYELGFSVFYFLPIAIAAWKMGSTSSYLISILSSIVWFLSDVFSSHPYSSVFFCYLEHSNTALILSDHRVHYVQNSVFAYGRAQTIKGS